MPKSSMAAPEILSASTITGDPVVNKRGEDLGKIEDIMLDLDAGRVAYAVLSFGGFMGMGDKLFAIPWPALQIDAANKRVVLDTPKERLKAAPGFDKSHWPNMADREWGETVYSHYGQRPYWSMR